MSHCILLVDDNRHLRESIKLYLQSYGFVMILAENVIQATRLLVKQSPDIIIVDIVMPQKDGYFFINYVRSNYLSAKIPIIILTAKGMTADRIKGYNLGCSAYLSKPFDPNELVSIIKNLLLTRINSIKSVKKKSNLKFISSNHSSITLNFTSRELSVLKLVKCGLTNKEISLFLHTSKRNVEKYVGRLLSKTQTRNRTQLAQFILNNMCEK
uniref:TctD-like protein n=1 Tax=Apophlaea sinclairii TaxID=212746 RepID=A0A1C9CBS7_9FLOR|nr:hypothetical protein Apop_137 [Apophlaea sinclairii]AOM65827.1 hypothetical protein Apop_137 [Apophlaea sinclairii]